MATLRYTPLRHRMLADTDRRMRVGVGRANLYYPHYGGKRPYYARHSMPTLSTGEKRALADLDAAGVIQRTSDDAPSQMGRPLDLTESGSALLSEWNAKYGNPLTPEES